MMTWEAALAFAGCITVAFSPSLVLLLMVVSRQPELVVVMVGSAFVWLLAISLVALVWAVLVPARGMVWLLVLYAAGLLEFSRWFAYKVHMRLLRGLKAAGMEPVPPSRAPTAAALLPAAVAHGLGVGMTQTLVMQGDVLGRALLPGTLYDTSCGLSVFSAASLAALGMQLLNVLLSIIGWTAAYPHASRPMLLAMYALHASASATTVLSTSGALGTSGCATALPALFAVVLVAALVAVRCALTGLRGASVPRVPGAVQESTHTSTTR